MNFGDYIQMKLISAQDGNSETILTIDERHYNSFGIVHGGVYASLADSAAGSAAGSLGEICVTANFTLNYLRAADHPQYLRAIAETIKNGRSLKIIKVSIYDDQGKHLCEGLFTYSATGKKSTEIEY